MSEPFIGELRIFPYGYTPRNWSPCNGQLLSARQYPGLSSLLGNQFGGDGINNFGLPNLQNTLPLGAGANYPPATAGGEMGHILTVNEIPQHTHNVMGGTKAASLTTPVGNYCGASLNSVYATSADTTIGTGTNVGGTDGPHENMPPILALNICIALNGIFPSRP
jgi:microcystin-dependent protein